MPVGYDRPGRLSAGVAAKRLFFDRPMGGVGRSGVGGSGGGSSGFWNRKNARFPTDGSAGIKVSDDFCEPESRRWFHDLGLPHGFGNCCFGPVSEGPFSAIGCLEV